MDSPGSTDPKVRPKQRWWHELRAAINWTFVSWFRPADAESGWAQQDDQA